MEEEKPSLYARARCGIQTFRIKLKRPRNKYVRSARQTPTLPIPEEVSVRRFFTETRAFSLLLSPFSPCEHTPILFHNFTTAGDLFLYI